MWRLTALVVEVHVGSLFVLLSGHFRLLVPLEPRHVLLVEPPRVLLELSGGQELLVGALLEVEHEEQSVHGQSLKQVRQLALRRELRRQGEGGVRVSIDIARHVL